MKVRVEAPSRDDGPQDAPPSKTRRKKAMHDLQALGEALLRVDARRLATLDLPERLLDALALARNTTRHEARRRQLQYIGRLMRDVDPEPIRAALDSWAQGPRDQQARFAAVEAWRGRLLDHHDALDEFMAQHPSSDRALLVRAVDEARDERGSAGPPHKQRALFRLLRTIVDRDAPERHS